MRLSPLGIVVFVSFCALLFTAIVTMPEPMVYSFLVSPMVIPRGSQLFERFTRILAAEEPARVQPAPAESIPVESRLP